MWPFCGPVFVRVRISGPCFVIRIVCSNWAVSLLSFVRTVQPSLRSNSEACFLPWLIMGSMVKQMPGGRRMASVCCVG